MQKYYLETKKKKETEEEMMKQQLEKRRINNEKDFVRKFDEANVICEQAGIQEEIRDEYCRVNIIFN